MKKIKTNKTAHNIDKTLTKVYKYSTPIGALVSLVLFLLGFKTFSFWVITIIVMSPLPLKKSLWILAFNILVLILIKADINFSIVYIGFSVLLILSIYLTMKGVNSGQSSKKTK